MLLLVTTLALATPIPPPNTQQNQALSESENNSWGTSDTIACAALLALGTYDVFQTRYFLSLPKDQGWEEANPLLGKRPGALRLYGSLIAAIGAYALTTALLPAKLRPLTHTTVLTLEFVNVFYNTLMVGGVRLSF